MDFVNSVITPFEQELLKEDRNKNLVIYPERGKYYYYTAWPSLDKISYLTKDKFLVYNRFAYAGKYMKEMKLGELKFYVFENYIDDKNQEILVERTKSAFYEVNSEYNSRLKTAKKLEVVCNAQEARHYYVTNFTEVVIKDDCTYYYTIHPPSNYVGKHTGSQIKGWGKDMEEWSYFMNEGKEVVIKHTDTTAFYHVALPSYYQAKPKEYLVVRSPVIGKYYEATFWERKEGHLPNERHFTTETTNRNYVGKYLRTRSEGQGDGADHWAIFLKDGNEIEIEYDYDGKLAFYEVEAQEN